jgi:hypothetical protein
MASPLTKSYADTAPEDAVASVAEFWAGLWVQGVRAWAQAWFGGASALISMASSGFGNGADAMRYRPEQHERHQG